MKPAITTTSLLLTLIVFWLLLSGMYTPFLLAAGVGSAAAITLLSKRMRLADEESHPIHMAWGAVFSYWPWLIKEILISSWDVAKRIVNPALPISPTLVEFTPSQKTPVGLVTHANSITLTPGTIAVEVESGRFLVHSLTAEGAAALANSEMDRRCARLEGRTP